MTELNRDRYRKFLRAALLTNKTLNRQTKDAASPEVCYLLTNHNRENTNGIYQHDTKF
jgi:hypothetical protein